jgi:hypothetical protein
MVFFTPDATDITPAALTYSAALAQRFHDRGLRLIQINQSNAKLANGDSMPLVPDPNGVLHQAFVLNDAHGHGGFYLLDADGRVLFRALNILAPDELRQLVERQFEGSVSYETRTALHDAVAVGRAVPELPLEDENGTVTTLSNLARRGTGPVVLLLGGCAGCSLGRFATELALFAKWHPQETFVVVSSTAEAARVRLAAAATHIPRVTVFAAPRLYDDYHTRFAPPIVLRADRNGIIVSIENLTEEVTR